MADKRITDLPLILSGDISSLDVLPIVNVELDITNKVTTDQLKAYINSGLTDVFVTGGTYNTTTGVATFTNNTGGTFSVTGFYTGSTDVFVTGGTYLNGTTTFTNNTGGTFSVVGYYTGETSYVNSITAGTGLSGDSTTGNITLVNTLPDQVVTITGGTNLSVVGSYPNFGVEFTGSTSSFFTGGTVSGATNFTNGLTANTFSATTISGGTLYGDGSNLTGIPDYYLTGLTFDNGTYVLEASVNDGNNYFANLSILGGDLRVTGGTYNPATGIGTFTNNSGATFDVSGFLTGYTDHYVTGFTYDNINTFTIYDNSGNTFSTSINNLSATTISATTISATTYQNLPDNFTGYYLPLSGGTVTGATTFTNGLTANTISATTYQNLPIDPDTYVTGYTYNNNTFTIKQNQGQPDLTATINSVTGLTVNGNLTVTGNTLLQGLSATTISATTIGVSGDCIDDIYVSNIHSCSPLNINPLSEGNVFFGSSVSGVTIDTTNNRVGLGTSTPQTAFELVSDNTSSIGNVLRFRDSDSVVTPTTEQFIGKIEFFSNENSGGSTGVKSYVAGIQDANANSSIIFATTGGTGSLTGTSTTLIGERMRIDSVGNVGIGTNSPTAKLHINNLTTGDTILIEDSTNPDTTPFVIDASGNTSIGSSTYLVSTSGVRPNLQISSGSAGAVTLPINNTPLAIQSNSSTTVSLFSPNANLSQLTFGSPSDSYASILRYTPTSKQLLLSTNSVGGYTDFNTGNGLFTMRVTSGQTVGVGITNPTAKLQVQVTDSVSTNLGFAISNSGNTDNYFTVNNAGQVGIRTPFNPGNYQFLIRNTLFSNGEVRFNVSGDYHFTILDTQGYGFTSSPSSININTRSTNGNVNIWTQATNTTRLGLGGQDVNPTVARTRTIITPVQSNSLAFIPTGGTAIEYSFESQGNSTFQPTGGTATYTQIQLRPTYNTTGTYSGIIRGLFYNPISTSLVGATHRAIETVTGDVIFGSTSGNVGVGLTTPTAKLHITKDSTSPNIIVSDSGGTANDAYIRFEATSSGSPSYAFGADKSNLNTFKLNYSATNTASPSVGSTRISISTGGTISIPTDGFPIMNIGSADQIQISTSLTSSQIKLYNGTAGTLQSNLTQYSNYSVLEGNSGSVTNGSMYIQNSSSSGTTIFKNGTDDIYIYPDGTTNVNGGPGTNVLKNFYANGSFGFGIPVGTGSGSQMYRNGTTGVLGPLISDARVKQNIETIPNALSIVKNLRGVFFDWKDSDGIDTSGAAKQIGLIAQEVEEFLPEAVIDSGVKDYKTVRYSEMVSVLIEAIKEQQNQIDELKNQIEILKNGL